MSVIEVRGFSVEAFAAVLLFIGALGEADVGLAGEFTFFEGVHASRIAPAPLHGLPGFDNMVSSRGRSFYAASDARRPLRFHSADGSWVQLPLADLTMRSGMENRRYDFPGKGGRDGK